MTNDTLTHLRIIRTWAEVDGKSGRGIDPVCCGDIVVWIDEALKELEPQPPTITENAYGWKFYHCPKCGREFYTDRFHGRVNAMKFCDKCGQAVKWDG